MNKQLGQLTDLELNDVSPKLLVARDLQLAVPGSYRANEPIVRISHFSPSLKVRTPFDSFSQRSACRLSSPSSTRASCKSAALTALITLSCSKASYCLEVVVTRVTRTAGHEDLRLDERVMQLFGLVNTLLANDRNTAKTDLNIHT